MSTTMQAALADAARTDLPVTIALMRILIEAPTEAAAREALADALANGNAAADPVGAARLRDLASLWEAQPSAWTTVRSIIDAIDHDRHDSTPDDTLRYWSEAFDRLATTSPEASVALYSLGDPELLAAATAEVVHWMSARGLLGPGRDALDLGCGIGRFLIALAPHVRHLVGLDLSDVMVTEARQRCRDLPNVSVSRTTGRDLGPIGSDSLDLVLAADVFPYLVQAGGGLPARHVEDLGRVLRPGGAALIVNYSYRGDLDADRADVAVLAQQGGFTVERSGTAEFSLWDGRVFLLRKPAG